jgi:D-arabinose 1-dehydrogenase-like Zn-dependent alcohol dehydrogenase
VGSGITRRMASLAAAPGGAILHIGLQDNEPGLDTRRITLQEIAVLGTYTYTRADMTRLWLAGGRRAGRSRMG